MLGPLLPFYGPLFAVIAVTPPTPTIEPIYAVAALPVAAPDEPVFTAAEDLLRLNTSAVIDLVYLVEMMPFAPAGTSLPT